MSEQNGRALATLSPAAAPLAKKLELDAERMALLCRTLGEGLKPDEIQLFLAVAARTGLDPFLKQIYAIKGNGKFFIHVGIDGRRLIAQRTGLVDGAIGPQWCGPDGVWRDVWLEEGPPAAARYGVLKKGCREPFWGVARFRSFPANTNSPNASRIDHYLAKVAEDHALRKAFPYEMGATPTYQPELDAQVGSDGEAPEFAQAADHEGEYREVDQQTGEITETTPEPAPTEQEVAGTWRDGPHYDEVAQLEVDLNKAGARFTLPADDASPEDVLAWLQAKRSLLKHRTGA